MRPFYPRFFRHCWPPLDWLASRLALAALPALVLAAGLLWPCARAAALDAPAGGPAAALAVPPAQRGAAAATAATASTKDRGEKPTPSVPLSYVDEEACARCHPVEYRLWHGSHHELAMQEATVTTVLAPFDGASVRYGQEQVRFVRRGNLLFVEAPADSGRRDVFPIAYTIGVFPIQQYLVRMPKGRLQSLPLGWDVVGRRWLELQPKAARGPGDPFFWTGVYQCANAMCIECHTTGFRKNYDPQADTYESHWARLGVGCQACHGPGSRHVAWADAPSPGARPRESARGLTVRFEPHSAVLWRLDPKTLRYHRSPPPRRRVEVEVCARCHSHRRRLAALPLPGTPFLDGHEPDLLSEPLYYRDGQIREEVYVYGSFAASKMYQQGVRCSDCHDPHSLRLRYPDGNVCLSCHLSNVYADERHHHHEPASPGADCLGCHMPARTYMRIDRRRDHWFRAPRPALSVTLGTPDPCRACHSDRPKEWTAEWAARWWGGQPSPRNEGGWLLARSAAAAEGGTAAGELAELALDEATPPILRATLLVTLAGNQEAAKVLPAAARSPSALVRLGAARALARWSRAGRMELLAALAADPIRAVRLEAARALAASAGVMAAPIPPEADRAIDELEHAERLAADLPAGLYNLGLIAEARGRWIEAERAFARALTRDPAFHSARLKLAALYQQRGQPERAEAILREGLEVAPQSADLHYWLGLLLAERNRWEQAAAELSASVDLDPQSARRRYNYALALERLGRADAAIEQLLAARQADPADVEVVATLALLAARYGRRDLALKTARAWLQLAPADPRPSQMLELLADAPGFSKHR